LLHFKGLGGTDGVNSITAEFTVKSVLNDAGTEVLGATTISGLSGNLNVNNIAKTINNDFIGAAATAGGLNSARGTVYR
jgi:hypothetical protein